MKTNQIILLASAIVLSSALFGRSAINNEPSDSLRVPVKIEQDSTNYEPVISFPNPFIIFSR